MNAKDLESLVDSVLKPAGFRRQKDTWYRTNDDTITLLNLQKSQWGGQYFVNLGVYLRHLGRATSPPEYQAHIRTRLDSIAAGDKMNVERAFNLEEQLPLQDRRDHIQRVLTMFALPFLAERSILPRLRELQLTNEVGPVLITKDARLLLGSN